MLVDANTIIRYKNTQLSSKLEFNNGTLTLNVHGYIIENNSSFSQHWETSEDSFKQFGNQLEFDLTGFNPYEITNFELEFKLPIFTVEPSVLKEIPFTCIVKYSGLNQEIRLFNEDERIDIKENVRLEDVFRQLNRTYSPLKKHLRCCFGCTFSGYERGGNSLFCMKNNKDLYLSKSFQEWYNDFYIGLELELVSEFYYCNQFEIDTRGIHL